MTDRERLEENAEDAFLALLMNDFAEREGEYYMAENERLQNDPSAAVPEDVERRALQLIEREMTKQRRTHRGTHVLSVVGRVLIAAVIAVLLFSIAFALSPTVRAGTLNFLMQADQKMSSWQFEAGEGQRLGMTSTSGDSFDIEVGWTPPGYTRQADITSGPADRILDLTNDHEGLIRISVHNSNDGIHTLDLEDADSYSNIIIQGCDGILRTKDDAIRIDWPYYDSGLVINIRSADVDEETLICVAESIRITE